jgi:hypothetical protein
MGQPLYTQSRLQTNLSARFGLVDDVINVGSRASISNRAQSVKVYGSEHAYVVRIDFARHGTSSREKSATAVIFMATVL